MWDYVKTVMLFTALIAADLSINYAIAKEKFLLDKMSMREYGGLAKLYAAGWDEHCPSENYWTFTHKDLIGVCVRWYFYPDKVEVL